MAAGCEMILTGPATGNKGAESDPAWEHGQEAHVSEVAKWDED